jgi:hypothetical protein
MTAPLISVRNLHKWYSGVHPLKGVNLERKKITGSGRLSHWASKQPRPGK